jgi:hypothetical protein
MKVRVSEATGPVLDWMVAKAMWGEVAIGTFGPLFRPSAQFKAPCRYGRSIRFKPSTDWSQGGPIIEREGIAIDCVRCEGEVASWVAALPYVNEDDDDDDDEVRYSEETGPTPLVAAMRCFVVSRLGEEVEVPEELLA